MVGVREVQLSYSAHIGAYGNLVVGDTLGSPYAADFLGTFALHLEYPHLIGVGNGQAFARVAVAVLLYQFAHQTDGIACRSATLQGDAFQLLNHKHSCLVLHRIPTAIGGFSYA